MATMTASEALDHELPELRAALLQIAAQLDRLDRAQGEITDDPRMRAVRQAIDVLAGTGAGRAEQIQLIFSRPHEEDWKRKLEMPSGT